MTNLHPVGRAHDSDQVAIVTGGASGIGRATAERLQVQGFATYVFDPAAVSNPTGEAGTGSITFVRVDVSDAEQVQRAVTDVVDRHGRVDVLVNNAGVLRWGGTDDTSEEDWDLVFAVNLKGPWLASRAVVASMKQRGSGSILNVGSNMAVRGVANQVAYSASKGGLVALTRSMAVDLGPYGIRVNCVNPGHIHTPMGDSASVRLGLTADGIRARYPLQRIGEPTEVAEMIVAVATGTGSFVTGAVIAVDGGFTA